MVGKMARFGASVLFVIPEIAQDTFEAGVVTCIQAETGLSGIIDE